MHPFVSYVAILLCFNLYFPSAICATFTNLTDHAALLAFKAHITKDPMDVTTSWNESLHFCLWKGVSCSPQHQRVSILNLNSQGLSGSISPSIANLSFLRLLDLSNNSFRGVVPPEIGRLSRLQRVVLANNSLTGPIPVNLSSCFNLRILHLSRNNFTGHIPAEFGSMSNLVEVYLDRNYFEGPIPDSFGNISSLKVLSIQGNEMRRRIPESIGQLKSLNILNVADNSLSGLIPSSIYNLSYLTTLFMRYNQLEGSLPWDIGLTLPNIQVFRISANHLSGVIPVSLSNASNLEFLELSCHVFGNNLGKGQANELSFITSLVNCSQLIELNLDGNNFGGQIPSSLANLSTHLQVFGISGNKISGGIPSDIGNLIGLNSLSMHYNQLTGTIPEGIGKLYKLQEVGFGKNKLSGEIPSSIGNLTLLNQLWLEQNNLQGSIPSSLGNCKNLFLLRLYNNELNGTIPPELASLPSLSKSLDLDQNRLTGPLPMEVGNLKTLVKLNFSHNELSGEIPSSLGGCTSLQYLYMDHNYFTGQLPSSLSSLRGIEEVDLSHNNFSGMIPKYFSTFPFLVQLNLSFNDFQGDVPVGRVFSNVTALSLVGNDKLCGGIPELQLPSCLLKKPGRKNMSLPLKLTISLIFGLVGLFLILFAVLFYCFKMQRKRSSTKSSLVDPFMKISYGDLLKATDGFSSGNLIGIGSFGSVYKGVLEDQIYVAVKVLNLQRIGASKSFFSECKALRNIRHRNLVKILTACSTVDYRGNEFKALVYEFMPNKSLEAWLHSPLDEEQEQPRSLSLCQRLNIITDVAVAVDYLHNHCELPIIHCDIKPSNVLLDDSMTAHLGDFGLARITADSNSEVISDQTSSVGLKGTIGYAAPEYGMGSKATKEGVLYSFGILLLHVFTGKRPTDDMFRDGLNLHKLVQMCLDENVEEIVDPTLVLGEAAAEPRPHLKGINECLISLLRIGEACSRELPRDRMEIHDALNHLLKLKTMF
ncbi:probable LRR receptor-like serine/threonine-protein kinase At3g47570 [Gossypium hirsutum]|uniref:Probable LRR receptor-like serine/threonine-protein kinase At3g47570 n=1 Tax=Gossypium hirsutum TaxID=3635 RepID=A0ABM3AN19_GOSHI|nr:probable LRR receptor-like serine/threonine-protein kinase At3g47570 [Gossypium hirsutum]